MKIVTMANRYNNHWVVLADWYGKERVVHSNTSLFAVLAWVKHHEKEFTNER
jgi:hypothetical protein